ncbi:MAG: sugar transferase [Kiritimatiellae bacterium]|nr:sugar transferase [Kiritimatiellia bacterium]
MLHRTAQFRGQISQALDALVTAVAFTLALAIRRGMNMWRPDLFPPFDALWQHAWLYLLLLPLWIVILESNGYYQHPFARSRLASLKILFRANVIGVAAVFFLLYLLKVKHIPRVLVIIFAALDVLLLWIKDAVTRQVVPLWSSPSRILLVGAPGDVKAVQDQLRQQPAWSVKVLGLLRPEGAAAGPEDGPPVLGTPRDLARVLHEQTVDSVLLAPGRQTFEEIQELIQVCETEGVEAWLLADFFRTSIARACVDQFQARPVLVFRSTPTLSWALVTKRVMDVAGALLLLALLSPLFLAVALVIKLTSPGPILFRQKRCTLHGRLFTMLKFRTMVADAEQKRALLEERNEVSGPVFKIRDDPRVTPAGRFLRRHSLDELPQLFNVLAGDMSLVGPRPPIPSEVAKYENWQRRRLSMRAGLTCLWQVSGRNDLSFEDWMRLDLEYIDHWSLGLDLEILVKTPLAVIRGTGF